MTILNGRKQCWNSHANPSPRQYRNKHVTGLELDSWDISNVETRLCPQKLSLAIPSPVDFQSWPKTLHRLPVKQEYQLRQDDPHLHIGEVLSQTSAWPDEERLRCFERIIGVTGVVQTVVSREPTLGVETLWVGEVA